MRVCMHFIESGKTGLCEYKADVIHMWLQTYKVICMWQIKLPFTHISHDILAV